MNWLYETAINNTKDMTIPKTIGYINDVWFDKYFEIVFDQDNKIFRFFPDGKKLKIKGQGSQKTLISNLIDFIKNCKLMDNNLIKHLDNKSIPPKRFLVNTSLSCALDSILSIMFFSAGGYFMARVEQSETDTVPRWIAKNRDIFVKMSKSVKDKLLDLYKSEWGGLNVNALQKDISLFIENDCNDIKVGYEIWGVLASMFDKLSFDLQTKREYEIGNTPVNTFSIVISEDTTLPGDLHTKPHHLIYLNDKYVMDMDYRGIGLFEEIDGYKLVGIMNHTGSHYISKIFIKERWYSYDDLNAYIKEYDGDILIQTPKSKIVMLFYVKM